MALYALLTARPVSSYVRIRAGGFPIERPDSLGPLDRQARTLADTAETLHAIGVWSLIAIPTLHVGAAFYHGLIPRDGVWQRIWPLVRS